MRTWRRHRTTTYALPRRLPACSGDLLGVLDLDLVQVYNPSEMRPREHAELLREVGLVPTIQRLAILDWLSSTDQHPTADQVLAAIRKEYPSISRATVYNTLDALTKAGMVLRLSVDPTVARYDADLGPHAHFRCRICERIYDIPVDGEGTLDGSPDGHLIESVRTYAYGICAACRTKTESRPAESSDDRKGSKQPKTPKATSAPDPSSRQGISRKNDPEGRSSSSPPRTDRKEIRQRKTSETSSPYHADRREEG